MENRIKSLIKKLSRFGFSVKPKKENHIDPVCGMTVSDDSLKADYKGKSYYFCSSYCKEQFVVNHGEYVD